MASVFKRVIGLVLVFFCLEPLFGQVNINFSISPPFTPFISDYIQPQRLDDINVSLFNTTTTTQRLKFKISLTNQSKGISVVLKDNVSPVTPIILNPNELLFLTLSDVGTNYGKLDQTSFTAVGINIQSAILDGTLPDGLYEICIQAFDFDAVGFTKPISNGSPTGCFSFNVNYTDPPTDIRINGNLINYTYGGAVPFQGFNKSAGQNFVINFTPPAFNAGCDYLYTLYIFEESMVNPALQQESQILQAFNTLIPTISKTSSIPTFFIDASDPILDENKNYYVAIKAEDQNSKTVFKNKGFSTFKAFKLFDNTPINFGQLELKFPNACGSRLNDIQSLNTIKWDFQDLLKISKTENPEILTRVKVVMTSSLLVLNSSIMNSNVGQVIIDTSFFGDPSKLKLTNEKSIAHKLRRLTDTLDKKFIISVQVSVKNGSRYQGIFNFPNNGLPINNCEFVTNPASNLIATNVNSTVPIVTYPVDNDTLPFQYIPVVVQMPVTTNTKIAFSQFNSDLEPLESFKYLKLTTDVATNNQLNSLSLDSSLKKITELLNTSANFQLKGKDIQGMAALTQAQALVLANSRKAKVMLNHALNMKQLPLGNSVKGKFAIARAALNYDALNQGIGNGSGFLNFPNIEKMIYLQPYKTNVMWTGKVGLYDVMNNGGMTMAAYETKFVNQSFTIVDRRLPMVKNTFRTFSGSYNVGMKRPVLTPTRGMTALPGKVNLSFLPSPMPKKLLPTMENNNAWFDFDSLFVAQQWNLEVSHYKNFHKLDTVISTRIIKNYSVAKGTSSIIKDLYSKVTIPVNVKDTGTYYWRVTWSNITLDTVNFKSQMAFWKRQSKVIGAALNLGQNPNFEYDQDSFFFKRTNYLSSTIDSFKVKVKTVNTVFSNIKPTFDVIYPMPGDTIPFQFPPVVFQNKNIDNADKFLLSRFDSDLEPLPISRYYVIQKHSSSDTLKKFSYDSMAKLVRKDLDLVANQQLTGQDPSIEMDALLQTAETRLGKKGLLQVIDSVYGMSVVPLGNNDTFKFKLISQYLDRVANLQLMGSSLPFDQNAIGVGKMLYLEPFKTVNWNSQFAFYNTTKNSSISVKSFEDQFANNPSFASTSSVSGSFNVGMKRPEIVTYYNGKNIPINKITVNFRPSKEPSRLIPNFETNKAWFQFQKLLVAQQWNIEVSQTSTFDSIIYRKSKKIVEFYSLPGSVEQMRNDLYNQRNEKIDLKTKGKHYYRVTWSNPVNLSTKGGTNDSLYMRYYISALAGSELINDNSELTEAGFKALSILKNYQFSVIDSFNVTDSVKIDTAVCGQDCNFDLAGISLTPAANHIAANDIVKVGKFDMTVTEISFSGNNARGKGLIFNRLVGKKVKVIFTNVQFNADKRLVNGVVTGEISSGNAFEEAFGLLPPGIPLADLAKDKLKDPVQSSKIYRYINSPFVLGSDIFSDDPITLPIGISKEVDNFPATIAFTDMIFTPTRATVNAAAVIYWVYEEQQQFLGFTGNGFCMNEQGLAYITNGASLELVGDIPMQINDSLLIKIIGKQDINPNLHSTRIEWDCKGLKDIALVVTATLPRSIFVPEENNKRSEFGRVTGIAEVHISSIQNFMVAFAIDKPFQFAPLPEFTFKVNTVSLDMSDHVNPAGITFPAGYNGQTGNAWRGLYIGEAEIKLPLAFESKNSPGTRLALNTRHLLIDPSGFTANIGVDNILALQDGELASWKFSIDRLAISIINNTLSNCALTGSFGVPLFTGNIGYELAISPNLKKDSTTLNFTLAPKDTLTMAAWFAQVTILQTSTIKLNGAISDINSWKLSSNLNGDIGFGADNMAGVKNVRLGKLPFEGLKLATYITNLDSFEFNLEKLGGIDMNRVIQANSVPTTNTPAVTPPAPTTPTNTPEKQEMAGFPIGIGDFSLDIIRKKPCMFELPGVPADAIRIGIKFRISLNLSEGEGDKKNGLSGSCGLGLYAYMQKSGDFLSFTPAGLNVDTIKIDLEVGGVATVRGAILFMANDPVFGNGFQGMAEAHFVPDFSGSVSAIFGEKDGERYFMFDAQIGFSPGIPIDFSVGAIFANSFGGGIWYKMKMTPGSPANAAAKLTLGRSYSGNSFKPDKSKSLGFEARLGLTGPPGTPVFGEVTLAAEFSDQWGLDKLSFGGNLWFTQKQKDKAEVFIAGRVTMDIKEKKLLGSLGALVNVANGTVRGRTETKIDGTAYYIAGNVDLLVDFSKGNWHIKIGDPYTNNRLGLGFYAGTTQLFEAGGYFMLGNTLTGLPPIKPEMATNLENVGLVLPSSRNVPPSDSAFAIIAGIDASIPEKRVELGMFFAGISAGFAVDGILEKKTQNCPRNGFKGWYVTGKAYAALNGALGLKVSTPFFTGDVIAGEINAGAILDAGFANPYYLMGRFRANYSVFGGLFEGSNEFSFEYLEDPQCRPVLKSTLVYGGIISDRTPSSTSPGTIPTNLSVGVEPLISFTYKLDEPTKFEFPATVKVKGIDIDTILTKFIRIKMDNCSMSEVNGNTRTPITINTIKSDDDMDMRIKPLAFLKDKQTKYEVRAKFHIEEQMKGTNTWNNVKRKIGSNTVDWDTVLVFQFITEQKATFHQHFVTRSNPQKGERYYKKYAVRPGKIVTKQTGVEATFFSESTRSFSKPYYEYYMECSPASDMSDTFRRPLRFNDNVIEFDLPNSKIENERYYQIRIIRLYHSNLVLQENSRFENADITRFKSGSSGANIIESQNNSSIVTQIRMNEAQISMRQRKSGSTAERRVIMHTINFGVSKHNNMTDKLAQLQLPTDRMRVPFSGDVVTLSLNTNEAFEEYEVNSFIDTLPNGSTRTITPPIVLRNYINESLVNDWYKNYYRPKIYNAFDTLKKKFILLEPHQTWGQFRTLENVSTKMDGMNVALDEHIAKPYSYNSMMFDYRVAQISYSSLQSQLRNIEFLTAYDLGITSQTVLNQTFDPITGTNKNGPPIVINTPPPPPPRPASGSRLTLEFTNYNLVRQQHEQLMRLGEFVFNTCSLQFRPNNNTYEYYFRTTTLPTLIATLNLKEYNLLHKVRLPSRFPFVGSTDLDLYHLEIHRSTGSTTAASTASFSNSEIFGLRQAIFITVSNSNGN